MPLSYTHWWRQLKHGNGYDHNDVDPLQSLNADSYIRTNLNPNHFPTHKDDDNRNIVMDTIMKYVNPL